MADHPDLTDEEVALVERVGREGGFDVRFDDDRRIIVGLMARHRMLLNYVVKTGHQASIDFVSLNKVARPWFKRRYGYEAAPTSAARQ